MPTEKKTRRKYTEDFKRDAVALVTEQGYKVSEAARSLGINDNLLRRWRQAEPGLDALVFGARFRVWPLVESIRRDQAAVVGEQFL